VAALFIWSYFRLSEASFFQNGLIPRRVASVSFCTFQVDIVEIIPEVKNIDERTQMIDSSGRIEEHRGRHGSRHALTLG
jgi:hypothetical protein